MNNVTINCTGINSVPVNNISVDNVSNGLSYTDTPIEPPIVMLQPIARYSARGKTNQDTDRDILKDLTGNGHDISLKNFVYSQMSGYGGYNHNFNDFRKPTSATYTRSDSTVKFTSKLAGISTFEKYNLIPPGGKLLVPKLHVKVSGYDSRLARAFLAISVSNLPSLTKTIEISNDGIYEMEETEITNTTDSTQSCYTAFKFISEEIQSCNIVIEQIPEYPDGLCFDGVDDYGINDNQPILTDYTVIAKRIILENTTNATFLSKWYNGPTGSNESPSFGAYIIDRMVNKTDWSIYSFGARTSLATEVIPSLIVTQSLRTYNGLQIPKGNFADTKWLILGATAVRNEQGSVVDYMKCVMYDVIIYDRTLTPEEIESEILKYNLVPGLVSGDFILQENMSMILLEDNNLISLELNSL